MSFTEGARSKIMRHAFHTCQDTDCYGLRDLANFPRQFLPTGDQFEGFTPDGELILVDMVNGDFFGQASHINQRDYRYRDNRIKNSDGSDRAMAQCVTCHVRYEEKILGNHDEAVKLARSSTILFIDRIKENGGHDLDIPHGIFSKTETRRINNYRAEQLERLLLAQGAQLLMDRFSYDGLAAD
jgi:hypothetical protein